MKLFTFSLKTGQNKLECFVSATFLIRQVLPSEEYYKKFISYPRITKDKHSSLFYPTVSDEETVVL